MKSSKDIRIAVQKVEGRPGPFHWELFDGQATKPFLISRSNFRTAQAAREDAEAVLERHRRRP